MQTPIMRSISLALSLVLFASAQEIIVPEAALRDETIHIVLTGLPAGQEVTLHAVMEDDLEQVWRSEITFLTDETGRVEVATQAPLRGNYTEADPMGFLWSMEPDGFLPLAYPFADAFPSPLSIEFELYLEGEPVASAVMQRLRVDPEVTWQSLREEGLVGTLFLPPQETPARAVLVLGSSEGGMNERDAALLASRGYVVLALAYFGMEELPARLENIPLEYFETAMTFLQGHERVAGQSLAVMGWGRGGELALLLGSRFPALDAVVAWSPSSVIFPADSALNMPAWTYGGEGVPFAPTGVMRLRANALSAVSDSDDPESIFSTLLENPDLRPAIIPLENTEGAILLVSGMDDPIWPSFGYAEFAMYRLQQQGFTYPHRHLAYEGAGFWINSPHVPTTVTTARDESGRTLAMGGGTPSGNARANADAWREALEWLETHLRQRPFVTV